jgi:uncharacterized protein YpmB
LESQFEKERQEQKYIKLQLESDKKAQEIKLINILRAQREQVYNNLKLVEENQRERLKFSELESEKKEQLRLAKLETRQKNNDINNYKKLLAFKEKINTYYFVFIVIFIVLILLLLYAYKQRAKSMKQRDELHALAMEKKSKIQKYLHLLHCWKARSRSVAAWPVIFMMDWEACYRVLNISFPI